MLNRFNKRKIILFITFTIILFCYNYFLHAMTCDEIYNYGFSYNIAKGAIPYKTFNMVVLPFYPLLMSIPLLFLNHLIVWHLVNAIFISIILVIIEDNKKNNIYALLLYILIIPVSYGYNTFILMLLLLVLFLEKRDYKYNFILIPLILGVILVTKQNIGILLFIAYFVSHKNKIKALLYCFIPILLTFIYLLITNSLIECIDYCFLGLGNFTENLFIQTPIFIILEVVIIIYLLYNYLKTKDINIIYICLFQLVSYPLLDTYHLILGLIPVIYYLLINTTDLAIKRILVIFPIILVSFTVVSEIISIDGKFDKILSDTYPYNMRKNNNIYMNEYNREFKKLINNNKDKRIFIFTDSSAYYMKMILNEKIDKYDLINKGNMGSNEEKYIDELNDICSKEECLVVMATKRGFFSKGAQLNPIIREWVLNNFLPYRKISTDEILYYEEI